MDSKLKLTGFKNNLTVEYGLLYNWYAATDVRNIANTGWHLSTVQDLWDLMIAVDPDGDFPVPANDAGDKLKDTGTTHWYDPNTGTNIVGFNARGAAQRLADGTFDYLTYACYFWTPSQSGDYGLVSWINALDSMFMMSKPGGSSQIQDKNVGISIRLVKDSTSLGEGETGTYTSNDGKIYGTVCIGGKEWLSSNLAETKYRDGTTIPEITNNSAWAALSTGALSAYNNDWNNAYIGYTSSVTNKLQLTGKYFDSIINKLLLGFEVSAYIPPEPIPNLLLEFITDAYASPFDPTFTTSSGILNWNLGDTSTSINSNNFNHTYTTTGNKTVKVYSGTTSGSTGITSINMDIDNLVGTLDLRNLINLSGEFYVNNNPNLTSILNPDSSQEFTYYVAYSCNLTGTLDVSGLTGLSGYFNVGGNPNLTSILNPVSSKVFSYYYAYDCSLSGALDVSGLTGLGGEFYVYNNQNLNYIFNPISSEIFIKYYAYDCNLIGTLDISGLTGLGGEFYVFNNPNLTQILNPDSSQVFTSYYAYSCDLTGTLDVSGLTGLGGYFDVPNNPNLTQILNPVSSQVFTSYYAYGCDLTGTLDLTGLTGLGGNFWVYNNPNLTQILNPVSSQVFTSYYADTCNLTGTLDLTGLTGLGGQFYVVNNPNLTSILNPDSSQVFTYYWAYNCNLTGTLDVSGLTNLGGTFNVLNNQNLTHISLPTINQEFIVFDASGCALDLVTVDDIFAKMDTWYTSNAPINDLLISVAGGTNAAPTDCWENVNIVNLQSIFSSAGQTLNIYINCDPLETPIFKFTTNSYLANFDPTIIVVDGTLNWDLGDTSTSVDTNDLIHEYTSEGDKMVKIYTGTTDGCSGITGIDFYSVNIAGIVDISSLTKLNYLILIYNSSLNQILNPVSSEVFTDYYAYNCDLTGILDVSGLTGLGGRFAIGANPNLTSILNPISSQVFTYYNAYYCNLTGTLDVSGLTGLGGEFDVRGNPNLTQILNPVSSEVFTSYLVYDCSLTGTLDLTGLTGLGGDFQVVNDNDMYSRSNITQILNPTSSQLFQSYWAPKCNLTGTLDVSGLINLCNDFRVENNLNLTRILLPTLNQEIIYFDAFNCGLDLFTVDDIFAKLDTYYSSNSPTIGLTLSLAGGTNSPPTDCWDNVNIVSLQSIFGTAGKTLNIGINASCGEPPIGTKILEFTTNALTYEFDPTFTVVDGTLNWNLDDSSSSVNANAFSHTYASSGNKTVKVYTGTTDGCTSIIQITMDEDNLVGTLNVSNLTQLGDVFNVEGNSNLIQILNPISSEVFTDYNAGNCDLTETLDISGLTGLGGNFSVISNNNLQYILNPISSQIFTQYLAGFCQLTGILDITGLTGLGGAFVVNNNSNVTQILNPDSSQAFTYYWAYSCGLNGTLDVSGLDNLGGDFRVYSNSNLQYILNPVSSQIFNHYYASMCNLIGTLDVSGLSGLGGDFLVYNNINLQYILNPTSSTIFTEYFAFNCNLTGTLDISGLVNLSGDVRVWNNPDLTHISLPTINQQFTVFDASGCGLDLATVDDIFAKLDAWYSGTGHEPSENLMVNVASGTNSPPTDCSLNANIVNLTSIFNSAGQTFTYYINCNSPGPIMEFTTNVQISGGAKYGLLYNWYAAIDASNILASGWHLPSVDEFSTLMLYLDPVGSSDNNVAGGSLKETGFTYWDSPNVGATNLSKFNARGSGFRLAHILVSQDFYYIKYLTTFWTSTDYGYVAPYGYNCAGIGQTSTIDANFLIGGAYVCLPYSIGCPIRPIKDSTDLIDGETGTYIGNDGKTYRTICIDNQEWLADNLCETKYRTGDNIPEITNYTEWAALTIGALCAYNNTWSNAFTDVIVDPFDPTLLVIDGTLNWNLGDSSTSVNANSFSHTYQLTGNYIVKVYSGTTNGSDSITYINMGDDNLIGTLDISILTNLSQLYIQNNPSLNKIILPTINQQFIEFDASGCALDLTTVDDIFTKLDEWYSGVGHEPSADLIVNVASGTNSPPTDCWLNTNIINLESIFNSTAYTFTYYINCNSSIGTPMLHFITNASTSAFEPTFVVSVGTLSWDLGDNTAINANSFSHTYALEGDKTITIYSGTTDGSNSSITEIQMHNEGLVGTLDLSSLTNLGGEFRIGANPSLNTVINPISSQEFSYYDADNDDIIGELDLSGLTGWTPYLFLYNNIHLTSLILPDSSRFMAQFDVYNCDLTGTLDLRSLPGCAYWIQVYNNPNLTQILHGKTDVPVYYYWANNCNLTGTLDISSLIGLFGNFNVSYNSSLNTIINPDISLGFLETSGVPDMPLSYSAYNCDLRDTLDLSGLVKLGRYFNVYNNPNLTQILNPVSSEVFTTYYASNCDLTGTLDVSGLTGLGGWFDVNTNPTLTQILNPDSSQVFTGYYAHHCNLTGTLDVSGLTGLGGDFRVDNNPYLIEILNPVSSQVFTGYWAHNCDISGALDLTGLTGLGGIVIINNNPNLTQILNPDSSQVFTGYWANSCNLTGTLDVSGLTGLGGSFNVSWSNPNLNYILNPISSQVFTQYKVSGISLLGTLDLTGLTGLGGDCEFNNNANLNYILCPDSSQIFTRFHVGYCDLLGTLDLSSLTGLGGDFEVANSYNLENILNPSSEQIFDWYVVNDTGLTSLDLTGLIGLGGNIQIRSNLSITNILLPNSSTAITTIYLDNNNLTGTLDVSGLSGLAIVFDFSDNPNLSEILLPEFTNSQYASKFDAGNCSLGVSTVDDVFLKFKNFYTSTTPGSDIVVTLNGGTNSPPTDGSSNINIILCTSIFAAAGRTFTYYINT
jgi:uncharacterized protein (TIGR02145 family)